VFTLVFLVFTTVIILSDVLSGEEVTADNLYGGICVYLLIGFTWTILYWMTEILYPGSFLIGGSLSSKNNLSAQSLIYYSYVTLTTLGYGDNTPNSPYARSLSILGAIFGVLYVAVFISRLIGLYRSSTKS
jgi:hypothetical protein